MFTEQLTQALSIPAGSLPPANRANNATAYTVGPIDMINFRRVMAHVMTGVLTGSANVQAYLQGCNTSNGTYANISTNNTNNQAVTLNTGNTECTVEIRADQLAAGNRYVQLAVLVNANSAFTAAGVLAGEAAYKPANQYDANSTYIAQRLVM